MCLFYYAAEHLRTYLALSRFSAQPSSTLRFRFPREGQGGEGGGVIAICKPFLVLYIRRSIRDIGVFRLHGTRGRIQGYTLEVLGGIWYLWGLFLPGPRL